MRPQAKLDEAVAHHASGDEPARHAPFETMDLVARMGPAERERLRGELH